MDVDSQEHRGSLFISIYTNFLSFFGDGVWSYGPQIMDYVNCQRESTIFFTLECLKRVCFEVIIAKVVVEA